MFKCFLFFSYIIYGKNSYMNIIYFDKGTRNTHIRLDTQLFRVLLACYNFLFNFQCQFSVKVLHFPTYIFGVIWNVQLYLFIVITSTFIYFIFNYLNMNVQ